MKYLFFLLSLCTPMISNATGGLELLGGINTHKGPIDQNMMDKGSRPGWTGMVKGGVYLKLLEFGIGLEMGKWNYTNKESGYPLYNYPPNYSGPREPYDYILNGNNYTSVFSYINLKILDRKIFCSVGLTQGHLWVDGYPSNSRVVGPDNVATGSGKIPDSKGLTVGAQIALGYRINNNIRVKIEAAAITGGYWFRSPSDYATGFVMNHYPVTVGVVFHNFKLK